MGKLKFHRMAEFGAQSSTLLLVLVALLFSFPAWPDEHSDCITPGDVTDQDEIVAYSRCLLNNERNMEAIRFLEGRVTDHQSATMYAQLGYAYSGLQRWRLAQENYQKAHDIDPNDLKVAQGLLHVLFHRVMAISPQQVKARKATLPEPCWYQEEKLPPAKAALLTEELIEQGMDLADLVADRTSDVDQQIDVLMKKAMLLLEQGKDHEAYELEQELVDLALERSQSSGDAELRDGAAMILVNLANQHAASGHEEAAIAFAEQARQIASGEERSEVEFDTRHILESDGEKLTLMDVLVASGCDTITEPGR